MGSPAHGEGPLASAGEREEAEERGISRHTHSCVSVPSMCADHCGGDQGHVPRRHCQFQPQGRSHSSIFNLVALIFLNLSYDAWESPGSKNADKWFSGEVNLILCPFRCVGMLTSECKNLTCAIRSLLNFYSRHTHLS